MKKYLVFFLVLALTVFGCEEAEEVGEEVEEAEEGAEEIEEMVLECVESSPTYKERGGKEAEIIYLVEGEGLVVYEASLAGYGAVKEEDRTAFSAQREREVTVSIDNGKVISAVTDGVYDELSKKFIETPRWIKLINLIGESGKPKIEEYFGEPEEIQTGENPDRELHHHYEKKMRFYIDKESVDRVEMGSGYFAGLDLAKYDEESISNLFGLPDYKGSVGENEELGYMAYEKSKIDIGFYEMTDGTVTVILFYRK